MRVRSRLARLEAAARPACDGRMRRLAGPDYVPGDADVCRACGGCHVLVIEEVVVETHADVERWRCEANPGGEA